MLTRMRTILVAVMAACVGVWVVFLTDFSFEPWVSIFTPLFIVLVFVVPFMLFAGALTMFVATFCGIRITPDGKLCYNPDNFWWKWMSRFYGDSWGTEVAFCKAYWFTDLFLLIVFIISIFVAILATFFVVVGSDVITVVKTGTMADSSPFLFIFIILAGIAVYVSCAAYLSFRESWLQWVGGAMLGVLVVAICVAVIYTFGVYPVSVTMEEQSIALGEALLIYGKIIGILIGGMAAAVGFCFAAYKFVMWLLFTIFPKLRNTWIGKFYLWIHDELCPIVTECKIP